MVILGKPYIFIIVNVIIFTLFLILFSFILLHLVHNSTNVYFFRLYLVATGNVFNSLFFRISRFIENIGLHDYLMHTRMSNLYLNIIILAQKQ